VLGARSRAPRACGHAPRNAQAHKRPNIKDPSIRGPSAQGPRGPSAKGPGAQVPRAQGPKCQGPRGPSAQGPKCQGAQVPRAEAQKCPSAKGRSAQWPERPRAQAGREVRRRVEGLRANPSSRAGAPEAAIGAGARASKRAAAARAFRARRSVLCRGPAVGWSLQPAARPRRGAGGPGLPPRWQMREAGAHATLAGSRRSLRQIAMARRAIALDRPAGQTDIRPQLPAFGATAAPGIRKERPNGLVVQVV
jgi:hypothetical protein